MPKRRNSRKVVASVPNEVVDEILYLVSEGYYSNVADFVREALREHLRRIPWPLEEAEAR